ncbi:flavonol 3-O-glucosyltransferase-like isoform X2 [Raphanus sativus]|uniref:Glycosyltransferase n=1 Tax=Raphanus sativus TaxID=3726 RepID=A0A6J0MN20_RAPSA|nr:flavonol 3-O-glucosyltransferase-like isoform X2 [Raphanus sativus]XP_056843775.1 flavonol 3-O-glucosyltransferase-like isoform X2 [Raphanus sativus]
MANTSEQPTTDSHVAILAFPFGSHSPVLLDVTRRLASASPTTLFSFLNTAKSNSSLFLSDLPSNIRVHEVADGVSEGYVLSGRPHEAFELFIVAAPENFRKAVASAESDVGKKVTCLLTDAFFWFASDMAAEMKATWVAFWAAGPNSMTAHLYTDRIRDAIEVDGCMEETLGFIPGMEKYRVKDTPDGVVVGNLDSAFSDTLHRMGLALPRADAVFVTSFEELDPTLTNNLKSEFKRFFSIGPLALLSSTSQTETPVQDPYNSLAWIKKQGTASVAYISFGTVMTPPPGELVAIAEGLESSNVPFVWSLKEKNMVQLPKGFLERTREQGIVVPWVPQVELLKHESTGVYVTHCGWNSMLESVSGGVPMICRPCIGDNGLNGRAVEVIWEIGMMIIGGVFTRDGFVKCLDQVLVQDDGKKMKSNVEKLREQAHQAVSAKGSSVENFKGLLDVVVSTLN